MLCESRLSRRREREGTVVPREHDQRYVTDLDENVPVKSNTMYSEHMPVTKRNGEESLSDNVIIAERQMYLYTT